MQRSIKRIEAEAHLNTKDQPTSKIFDAVKNNSYEQCVAVIQTIEDANASVAILNTQEKVNNNEKANLKLVENLSILHFAVISEVDLKIIEFLLQKGADVHATSCKKRTILHDAVDKGHEEVVKLLIQKGIDVNITTDSGNTPLHFAALVGKEKIVALLIQNNAQVNAENYEKITPLHNAIIANNKEAVEILIRNGANIHAKANIDYTPLFFTTEKDDGCEIAKLLIDKGANVNAVDKNGFTVLHNAYIYKNKKILQLLIEHGAKINQKTSIDLQLLHSVEDESSYEVTEILIKHGANVNAKSNGLTPLHSAAKYPNNRKIIELLVKHGAKINAFCKDLGTPFTVTVIEAEKSKVKDLVKLYQYNDVKKILQTEDYKPIFKTTFQAIDEGLLETAKALLDAGAIIDSKILKENELSNKPLLQFLKERANKTNKKNDTSETEKKKIEKEKKIEQQREEKRKEKEKQKELTVKAVENIVSPVMEQTLEQKIEEKSKDSLIKIKVVPEQKNYTVTFDCPNQESCKLTKVLFTGKVTKLQTSPNGKIISFIVNESKLKELFESNAVLKDNLKKLLDTYNKQSAENEKDEQFIANWKNHIKKIFPFEVSINQTRQTDGNFIFDVVSVDPMNNEKIKSFANLISRHFANPNDADVIYCENKLHFKSKNKSLIIDKTTEISFKSVTTLRDSMDPNKEKTKTANTSQILKITSEHKLKDNKNDKTENVNANKPATLTHEEKNAFASNIKEFINVISGNIFTNKLQFFVTKRINNNRVEFLFDLAKYRSVSTDTTPIGTTFLFNNMKQVINSVMGKEVMYFDEKEYTLKFVFTNVSKEDVYKNQNEISQKIAELNIPDGKQEITFAKPETKESVTDQKATETDEELFSVEKFTNEVQIALSEIKKDNNKSTYLIHLLKTLNSYSPANQIVNDTIAFHAYKILATFTLAVISKEFNQNIDEPHIYNLRSVFRHAYGFYTWDNFHNRFSPFFKKLEEICIALFNSNNNSLFPANNSLKGPVKQLIEELNLFAPLLQGKILKAEPTEDDLATYRAQIESMQAELQNNEKDENCIYFAMLQLCCQIGENENANPLEKALYGKLHNPSLVYDPIPFLRETMQSYAQSLRQFQLNQ